MFNTDLKNGFIDEYINKSVHAKKITLSKYPIEYKNALENFILYYTITLAIHGKEEKQLIAIKEEINQTTKENRINALIKGRDKLHKINFK